MSNEQKNQEQNIVEQKNQRQSEAQFRGVIIPITEDNKFGLQLSGGVKLFEAYGVLSLIMEQLRKDIGVNG